MSRQRCRPYRPLLSPEAAAAAAAAPGRGGKDGGGLQNLPPSSFALPAPPAPPSLRSDWLAFLLAAILLVVGAVSQIIAALIGCEASKCRRRGLVDERRALIG